MLFHLKSPSLLSCCTTFLTTGDIKNLLRIVDTMKKPMIHTGPKYPVLKNNTRDKCFHALQVQLQRE